MVVLCEARLLARRGVRASRDEIEPIEGQWTVVPDQPERSLPGASKKTPYRDIRKDGFYDQRGGLRTPKERFMLKGAEQVVGNILNGTVATRALLWKYNSGGKDAGRKVKRIRAQKRDQGGDGHPENKNWISGQYGKSRKGNEHCK